MKTIKFSFIIVIGFALFFSQGCEKDDEDQKEQEVATTPVAAFTANQTSITVDSSVDFTDQSKNSPTDWSWDFGDGNTSTSQTPSHTYDESGTYTVSLTVTNNAGSDTETKTDYITVEESSSGNETGTFTDSRDGQIYEWVKIGNQVWMAENLKATHYSDGTPIPHVTGETEWGNLSETDKAWCYYDNSSSNGDTYGALYTWAAAMNGTSSSNSNPSGVQGVCPDGWHLPSDEEWKELEMALGMSQSEADDIGWRGTNEGSKLADSANLWQDGDLENNAEFGTSGFTAFPGGIIGGYDGKFDDIGNDGYWWSSTAFFSSIVVLRSLYYYHSDLSRGNVDNKGSVNGYSVRCIRD